MPLLETSTVDLTQPQAVPATTLQVWGPPGDDPPVTTIVLAHGAGTDMAHRHMQRHAEDLSARGHTVVLFNFAYTQAGRRRPDPTARLESAWRDVICGVREQLQPETPLLIGGRSMGGRIATVLAAAGASAVGVDGVVAIAYPLHPAGKPDSLRVGHWPSLDVPVLLVCGDRDAMAPAPALREQVRAMMPSGLATLHLIAGADHSFRARRADGRTEDEVFTEAADVIDAWCRARRT